MRLTLAGIALLLLVGCARLSEIRLVSYKDPFFPDSYDTTLAQSAWRCDHGGDYRIIAHAKATILGDPPTEVEQFVDAHLFWNPRPGKTPVASDTIDANIRYIVATERGVAVYRGTGFVFVKKFAAGKPVEARVEASSLRLMKRGGEAPEIFGELSITGTLHASGDRNLAIDLLRQADLRAGPE